MAGKNSKKTEKVKKVKKQVVVDRTVEPTPTKVKETERVLPTVPKKVGSLTLKLVKKDYHIVNDDKEVIGMLTTPKQLETYYMPCWSVWAGPGTKDVLIDCYVELDAALSLIQKKMDVKKTKKKKKV